MNLQGIRAGDIVRIRRRQGHTFYAKVDVVRPREVAITPLDASRFPFYCVTAREITEHYSWRGRNKRRS